MNLQGVIPPIPTPFTRTGDLDLPGLKELIRALEPDVDGFLVLGSTGEAAYLSEIERTAVIAAAREAVPEHKPMLVGTGGEATRLALTRNREAFEVGADAALVLPPHYYVGAMGRGAVLETHYRTLADSSPLPLMLYNFPAVTTLALSPELIAELAQHERIVGMKDSSGNVAALTETLRRVPSDFQVLTGSASTFLAALALGVRGGIRAVANVAARPYRRLWGAFDKGELQTARSLQLSFNPLAQAVTNRFGIPGLKAAMRLQGLPAGYPRAPLLEVDDQVRSELERLLAEADGQGATLA